MKSHLALITLLDGSGLGLRPDNTLPGVPAYPDQGLPPFGGGPVDPGYGQGHPSPPHPWFPGHRPDRPDNSLPGSGGRPDNTLPTPPPVRPDNTLPPTAPPPQATLPIVLPPGESVPDDALFELKYSPVYGWVLVPVKDPVAAPKA